MRERDDDEELTFTCLRKIVLANRVERISFECYFGRK